MSSTIKGPPIKRPSRASRDFASLSRIAGVFLRFQSIGHRFFATSGVFAALPVVSWIENNPYNRTGLFATEHTENTELLNRRGAKYAKLQPRSARRPRRKRRRNNRMGPRITQITRKQAKETTYYDHGDHGEARGTTSHFDKPFDGLRTSSGKTQGRPGAPCNDPARRGTSLRSAWVSLRDSWWDGLVLGARPFDRQASGCDRK